MKHCKMTVSTSIKHYKWRYWVSLKQLVGFGSWFRNLHFRIFILFFLRMGKLLLDFLKKWTSLFCFTTVLAYNPAQVFLLTIQKSHFVQCLNNFIFCMGIILDHMPCPWEREREKKKRYESLRPIHSRNF